MPLLNGLSAADRIDIEDLYSRYAWALDTGDVEGFADTFVPQSLVEVCTYTRIPNRYEGRQGAIDLAESLRVWDRFPGCQHYTGQLQLVGDGLGRCEARSYTFMTDCRGEAPYQIRFVGRTRDRLVRCAGIWLYEERLIQLWEGDVSSGFPAPGF
ncbi:hypothetical protein B0E42_22005 [Pseudomonas sp. A25(2017)]|uniref:SnoaL-like domain-containing protein n=1 Tax=Pseudomonas kilonensis TaxID=132476 RepID=A0ABY0ZHD5_9PSED|nr:MULTISPECIES: nuclear transport factor 2 family protein [Pseudomonas]OOG82517.1 hypothetical protein B0E42_22005 [Pseudomonas sp. A25(2017)]SEE68747.1 SnoaL-like domain-containing protein [Pseudomonas kilonensis]